MHFLKAPYVAVHHLTPQDNCAYSFFFCFLMEVIPVMLQLHTRLLGGVAPGQDEAGEEVRANISVQCLITTPVRSLCLLRCPKHLSCDKK